MGRDFYLEVAQSEDSKRPTDIAASFRQLPFARGERRPHGMSGAGFHAEGLFVVQRGTKLDCWCLRPGSRAEVVPFFA